VENRPVPYNPKFKMRADSIVSKMAALREEPGDGHINAVSDLHTAFAELSRDQIRAATFDLNGGWPPWFTPGGTTCH